ncbi:PadR family transcriptional regulator [Fulvivirgaceae bacterium BMA10]|uniref:PadR family transcriptional regulator n=1 Tax=Splendidivirga corallicola TaxID=3051826 RepID=A0ABT8KSB7_9BACT|nr:PadR family transcriptional regulator [Fulvivirgaceae bacterium BMA10]
MKGTNLGELEELVLLVVANLDDDAYGLAIRNYIKAKCERSVSISTVHATLHRLELKGFVSSRYDSQATGERGGRPKLLFTITASGERAMRYTRDLRNNLWSTIPKLSFNQSI